MAIKERGVKRNCQACGAAFYDLLNDPIICPKCGSEYDPEAILKSRKTRLPAEEAAEKIENEDAEAFYRSTQERLFFLGPVASYQPILCPDLGC